MAQARMMSSQHKDFPAELKVNYQFKVDKTRDLARDKKMKEVRAKKSKEIQDKLDFEKNIRLTTMTERVGDGMEDLTKDLGRVYAYKIKSELPQGSRMKLRDYQQS